MSVRMPCNIQVRRVHSKAVPELDHDLCLELLTHSLCSSILYSTFSMAMPIAFNLAINCYKKRPSHGIMAQQAVLFTLPFGLGDHSQHHTYAVLSSSLATVHEDLPGVEPLSQLSFDQSPTSISISRVFTPA